MNEIVTAIDIDAPVETVWAVLTDFERYPEWNRRMHITGEAREGARLRVDPGPDAGDLPTFKPRVKRADGTELWWLGHLVVPGLFDGEHRFRLQPLGGGRTRLIQDEHFSGLLVGPITRRYGPRTEANFHAVNAALKARSEALVAGDVAA
jgi:hypothetical protein